MSNLVIQTNVLALNAHRNTKTVGTMQEKASAKLSSGYKINSAADDAAGLAVSEKMRSQIRGLDMASKNAQDAISLIQTAEGGMQEIDNMIQRIRELVVYAANDTNDPNNGGVDPGSTLSGIQAGDRQKIQDEINSLMKEIDSMAGRVEFNKKKLITGDFAVGSSLLSKGQKLEEAYALAQTASDVKSSLVDVASNVASAMSDTLSDSIDGASDMLSDIVDLVSASLSSAYSDIFSDLVGSISDLLDLSSATATGAFNEVKKGIEEIVKNLRSVGDDDATTVADALSAFLGTNEFKDVGKDYANKIAADKRYDAAISAASAASDAVDVASDAVDKFSALNPNWWQDAAAAVEGKIYFQVGANANQGWSLNIGKITCEGLGFATGPISESGVADRSTGNIDPNNLINVLKMTGEGDLTGLLDIIDQGLTIVTTERSKLGAAQNRLEYTMKSLDISSENLQASESRIRNADMAKEMMNLTKANILQQASISMLAQANQAPQSVLQLLR